MPTSVLGSSIGVASPKMGAGKMFDRRQITLFCLEKSRSKHKMTIFSKNIWGAMAYLPPWLRLWVGGQNMGASSGHHLLSLQIRVGIVL